MKIYADRKPQNTEFDRFAGKDVWVRVVSTYDFDFSRYRAGVPFWLKVLKILHNPAGYGLDEYYEGYTYCATDFLVENHQGDESYINGIDLGAYVPHSMNLSDGSISLVKPIESMTTAELFGVSEERSI